MNKKMMFDETCRPMLGAAVGDVVILDGFFDKDGHKVTAGVIFSEYDGAYTVYNGGSFCHFLSKKKIKSGEVRVFWAEDLIPDDEAGKEFLQELKVVGEKRRHTPDAYMDFYKNDDSFLKFEENLSYLVEAIRRNGYLDVVA